MANRRNFIRRAPLKIRSPEVCREKESMCKRWFANKKTFQLHLLEHMLRSLEGNTPFL